MPRRIRDELLRDGRARPHHFLPDSGWVSFPIAFIHTEIEPRFEGHGPGSTLIAHALDAARADHLALLPFCPFVNSYIQRHPDYVQLVPPEHREAFGL